MVPTAKADSFHFTVAMVEERIGMDGGSSRAEDNLLIKREAGVGQAASKYRNELEECKRLSTLPSAG